MKLVGTHFIVLCLFLQVSAQPTLLVNLPTAEMEADYLWQNLQDLEFFEANNYSVSWPEGSFIDELKSRASSKQLTSDDQRKLENYVRDSVFDIADYQKAMEKIEKEKDRMNQIVAQIDPSYGAWQFKSFDTYEINLTLYGPGGSYDPDDGSIILFTTREGNFKNYKSPVHTIIHEIVHIGIQESLIDTYQVAHALKERIVDTFVLLSFGTQMEGYKRQEMGNPKLDDYLKTKEDLKDLPEIIERINR